MNIIVCIKQVPDTTEIKIDPVTNTLIREGVQSIINPFDLYAIEEAIRLKEQYGGKITAISMGPPQVAAHLAIPQVGFVKKIESYENNRIIVQRLMEDGYDRIELSLPAALTVVKEINIPRLPSLRGKRNAKKAELKIMTADDLQLDENDIPDLRKEGEKHELPADELAEILYAKLKEFGK